MSNYLKMMRKYNILLIIVAFCCFFNCIGKSNLSNIKTLEINYLDTTDYYNSFSKELNDSCDIANKIRATILEYIKDENELIYKEDFISSFKEINDRAWKCSFPRNNEEVNLYFYLGNSVLLNRLEKDERTMKLLVDLYLTNRNNAELSEYYGFIVLPKAASKNINSFIKVLSKYTDKDADKCIHKLKYIEDIAEKEKIKNEINQINNQEYLKLINKIKEVL